MSIPHPWYPVRTQEEAGNVRLDVWGRSYRYDCTVLPSSIITQGRELLYAPMRLTGAENGVPIVWEDTGCYLIEPKPECAIVNGYAQSGCLIADTSFSCEYDGAARLDIRVMPRGKTVPQLFGLEPSDLKAWELEELRLEIPLRREVCSLYTSFPKVGLYAQADGSELRENGEIPKGGAYGSFKAALWLGDEDCGLQMVCESDEGWQPKDTSRAFEIVDAGDHWVLRFNLLESLPDTWKEPAAPCGNNGISSPQISFRFGLMATPVKPWDNSYLRTRAVHIDCFTKVKGDYWPFLNGPVSENNPERVIDRLTRAGVNLLVLHEKWTKMQNYWQFATSTADEIRKLVEMCHARNIRVIPYFGYEITSSIPEFTDIRDEVSNVGADGAYRSGWYRVPYQRANPVCYRSGWAKKLAEGILATLDRFGFDGVYLDGTTYPRACANAEHGCGYIGRDGQRHVTYPIFPVRELMREIYTGVHARHGIVNPHTSGVTLPYVMSFSDLLWDGEHIQTRIRDRGLTDFPLPYFRADYLGRAQGIPVQFIVYEFPGVWSFDMALSLALLHGVYPRPNSVWHPLDVMERIWNILDAYGVSQAKFCGYWENMASVQVSGEVKVSYYMRKNVDGRVRLLLYVGNPGAKREMDVTVKLLPEAFGVTRVERVHDLDACTEAVCVADAFTLNCEPFSLRIFQVTLV
jgi:hypothetical protein